MSARREADSPRPGGPHPLPFQIGDGFHLARPYEVIGHDRRDRHNFDELSARRNRGYRRGRVGITNVYTATEHRLSSLSPAGDLKGFDVDPVLLKKTFLLGDPQRSHTRIDERNTHAHLGHLSRALRL